MHLLKIFLGFFASAFGMAQAIVGFALKGQEYKKAYLFDDWFGFKHPKMIETYKRPWTYHDLKDVWPSWLETHGQERPSKAIALLVVLLLIFWILF